MQCSAKPQRVHTSSICSQRIRPFTRHRSSCCRIAAQAAGRDQQGVDCPAHDRLVCDPPTVSGSGRRAVLVAAVAGAAALHCTPSLAIGFTKEMKKKKIPLEDYSTSEFDGLPIYELEAGSGRGIQKGDLVTVHFDCKYKTLDVVSTRAARLLSGNRTLAEPFVFVAGSSVDAKQMRADGGSANGLFAGSSGPKPPPALSTAVLGMKRGGKRSIIVPPEAAYGAAGIMEIPPNATIELQVEVLEVTSKN